MKVCSGLQPTLKLRLLPLHESFLSIPVHWRMCRIVTDFSLRKSCLSVWLCYGSSLSISVGRKMTDLSLIKLCSHILGLVAACTLIIPCRLHRNYYTWQDVRTGLWWRCSQAFGSLSYSAPGSHLPSYRWTRHNTTICIRWNYAPALGHYCGSGLGPHMWASYWHLYMAKCVGLSLMKVCLGAWPLLELGILPLHVSSISFSVHHRMCGSPLDERMLGPSTLAEASSRFL